MRNTEIPTEYQTTPETEEISKAELAAKEILADFNIPYRNEEAPIENYYRGKVLKKLQQIGVISVSKEGLFFDKDKLKASKEAQRRVDLGRSAEKRRLDILDYAKALNGVEVKDIAQQDDGDKKSAKPILVLPKNLMELQTGEYQKKALEAEIQPWEIGQHFKSWKDEIPLEDGEKLTFSELAMVQALTKAKARRNKRGELEIYDSENETFVRYSGQAMEKSRGGSFGGSLENVYMNSALFAKNQLPTLLRMGMIKLNDFHRTSQGGVENEINAHVRRININSGFVSFSSAQYYIGKTKLVGLGIEIDHDNMTVEKLDKETVAIVNNKQGEKTIVATFNLLNPEQLAEIQSSVKKRLLERGIEPTISKITIASTVGEKLMQKLIKKYSVTDYLKPRVGENPTEYYLRVKPLDNPDFVLKKVTGFFQQAGIGIHNLPWSEQLVLARALLVETDEQKLLDHAKKYGLPGVRAFLSLDLDANVGEKILKIGEKLDSKLAEELFLKYGEIVDAASKAAEYIRVHFPAQNELKNNSGQKLTEQLLKKGKDLLVQFGEHAGLKDMGIESVSLMQKLEQLKTQVLIFAATYKVLPKEEKVDFSEVANTTIEDKDSSSLTEEEKKQMTEIFTLNRLGNYPEKLLKQTQKDFIETLNTPGHTFRMLVHQGRLVAFLHYDQISAKEIYVGSLNLHPSAKDSPIAVAMLRAALEEKGGENKLKAIVWQNNPAGRFYKILGFRETGKVENYENTGEIYLQLERLPDYQSEALKKAA